MIIWIAGWPHCGSTLCRTILTECFDVVAMSKYYEPQLEFLFGAEMVEFGATWSLQKYKQCRDDDKVWFIKTHEAPMDYSPAIWITRDGRDACVALSHFWKLPVADIILAQWSHFTDWSNYYRAWMPYQRNDTVVITYEQMVRQPDTVAAAIAPLVGLEPKRKFVNPFEKCQASWPHFFKHQIGCHKDRLKGPALSLFWRCHGEIMRELGYSS